jgi:hypothetical protein
MVLVLNAIWIFKMKLMLGLLRVRKLWLEIGGACKLWEDVGGDAELKKLGGEGGNVGSGSKSKVDVRLHLGFHLILNLDYIWDLEVA